MYIKKLFSLESQKKFQVLFSSESEAEAYKALNKNIEILLFEASFYVYIKLICPRMTPKLDAKVIVHSRNADLVIFIV